MLHTVLLSVHVASGAAGLVLGPLAMAAPKRSGFHPRLGMGGPVTLIWPHRDGLIWPHLRHAGVLL